jgi:hypothetical protein
MKTLDINGDPFPPEWNHTIRSRSSLKIRAVNVAGTRKGARRVQAPARARKHSGSDAPAQNARQHGERGETSLPSPSLHHPPALSAPTSPRSVDHCLVFHLGASQRAHLGVRPAASGATVAASLHLGSSIGQGVPKNCRRPG